MLHNQTTTTHHGAPPSAGCTIRARPRGAPAVHPMTGQPLAAEYFAGWNAAPEHSNPFIWSSDAWGAWILGALSRAMGKRVVIAMARGHAWRFGARLCRITDAGHVQFL